jgi:hypothetical protein
VTRKEGSYFLALSIQNIFDNKVVDSKSNTCENCKAVQVIAMLKVLSGSSDNTGASEAALAAERKAKAEELKQEQLAFEEKLRNSDASERKRLLAAKAEDDKHIAELKVQADARRKSSGSQAPTDFPTIETAIAEINRLKESITGIEKGYDKELAQTRKKVSDRYALQLAGVDKIQRDEFESTEEFKSKQDKKRSELNQQRDEELRRMTTATLAAADIAPLREKIKALSEREYTLSNETLLVNLGGYNADGYQFPVSINSKVPSVRFEEKGTVPLPIAEAKIFKQQWVAGLIRAEVKMKPNGETGVVAIVNDADNSRLSNYKKKFITKGAQLVAEAAEAAEAAEKIRAGRVFTDCPSCPQMVVLPPNDGKSIAMGKYEVTQKEWFDIMKRRESAIYGVGQGFIDGEDSDKLRKIEYPSRFGECGGKCYSECGGNCPVENVSWNDVQQFIQKLNAKTGKKYRLPTDVEWEFACYGGSQTTYCGSNDINSVAWHGVYGGQIGYSSGTHPVGQKQANAFGLFDMSGNVWEWVEDKYDNEHDWRTLRGGSWTNWDPQSSTKRADYRLGYDPSGNNGGYFGFRLARTMP